MLEAAADFDGVVRDQERKLSYVGIFRSQDDKQTCPVCESHVPSLVPAIADLRTAADALAAELAGVSRDRPKLDAYLREQQDELQLATERLAGVRRTLAALVAQDDAAKNVGEIDLLRSRIVGRISYYLDSRRQLERASPAKLDDLRSRLSALEGKVDEDAKREQLEIEAQTVAALATTILKELPLAVEYRDAPVYFLARKLECGVVTAQRRVPMRDVGSDENYLSLHVAVLVALHRFFKLRGSPVPGVLLLDQVSRPYFPPETPPDEVVLDDTETSAVKRYFDFLFRETQTEGDLQVIVLEHAYFASDPRFTAATKKHWSRAGEKLIPDDWPRAPAATADD